MHKFYFYGNCFALVSFVFVIIWFYVVFFVYCFCSFYFLSLLLPDLTLFSLLETMKFMDIAFAIQVLVLFRLHTTVMGFFIFVKIVFTGCSTISFLILSSFFLFGFSIVKQKYVAALVIYRSLCKKLCLFVVLFGALTFLGRARK